MDPRYTTSTWHLSSPIMPEDHLCDKQTNKHRNFWHRNSRDEGKLAPYRPNPGSTTPLYVGILYGILLHGTLLSPQPQSTIQHLPQSCCCWLLGPGSS